MATNGALRSVSLQDNGGAIMGITLFLFQIALPSGSFDPLNWGRTVLAPLIK
jgi:hypothetical protein